MKRWALIENDVCVTIVEQNEKPDDGEWINIDSLQWFGPGCRRVDGSWQLPNRPEGE